MVTPTPDVPYRESFNDNDGQWISGQLTDTISSWLHTVSPDSRLSNTDGGLWITGQSMSSDMPAYRASEQSFVESPCIDLGLLDFPMLSFKYWMDTDQGDDGAVVQYKVGDGAWRLLGAIGLGDNWYNRENIIGTPGGSEANERRIGWSGRDTTGLVARFGLDEVKQAIGDSTVRFRIVFGSSRDLPSEHLFGFAFDDFTINNRDRVVVVEHFTNSQQVPSLFSQDTALTNLLPNNQIVVDIRYHTSFPTTEPLITRQSNRADISARALHYGVASLPHTVLDGSLPEPGFLPLI
ncbi:MAG: hypothetical protein HC880_20795 [Bacteroidia bacterium]|nr:hypothetical protein [Bacteroidia bacterium]